jgi:hypothetical protein
VCVVSAITKRNVDGRLCEFHHSSQALTFDDNSPAAAILGLMIARAASAMLAGLRSRGPTAAAVVEEANMTAGAEHGKESGM